MDREDLLGFLPLLPSSLGFLPPLKEYTAMLRVPLQGQHLCLLQ